MNEFKLPPEHLLRDSFRSLLSERALETQAGYDHFRTGVENVAQAQFENFKTLSDLYLSAAENEDLDASLRDQFLGSARQMQRLAEAFLTYKDEAEGVYLDPDRAIMSDVELRVFELLRKAETGTWTEEDFLFIDENAIFLDYHGYKAGNPDIVAAWEETLSEYEESYHWHDVSLRYQTSAAQVKEIVDQSRNITTDAEDIGHFVTAVSTGAYLIALASSATWLGAARTTAVFAFSTLTGLPTDASSALLSIVGEYTSEHFENDLQGLADEFSNDTGTAFFPIAENPDYVLGALNDTLYLIAADQDQSASLTFGSLEPLQDIENLVIVASNMRDEITWSSPTSGRVVVQAQDGDDDIVIGREGLFQSNEIVVDGGDGRDKIDIEGVAADISGGDGDDEFFIRHAVSSVGGSEPAIIEGGRDNDTFSIDYLVRATVTGGQGQDTLDLSDNIKLLTNTDTGYVPPSADSRYQFATTTTQTGSGAYLFDPISDRQAGIVFHDIEQLLLTPNQDTFIETVAWKSDLKSIGAGAGNDVFMLINPGGRVISGGSFQDTDPALDGKDTITYRTNLPVEVSFRSGDSSHGSKANILISGEFGTDRLYSFEEVVLTSGIDRIIVDDLTELAEFGGADSVELTIDGHTGVDTLDASASLSMIEVNLQDADGHLKSDGGEIGLLNIENVLGTSFGDILIGGDSIDDETGGNILSGLAGDDIIEGRDGDDIILGGDDRDVLDGGAGHDLIFGSSLQDYVEGNDVAIDEVSGGADDDIIIAGAGGIDAVGGNGEDLIIGSQRDDQITGGEGHDYLVSGGGSDTINGGAGKDFIDVSAEGADATIHFDADGGHDFVRKDENGNGVKEIIFDGLSSDDVLYYFEGTEVTEVIEGTPGIDGTTLSTKQAYMLVKETGATISLGNVIRRDEAWPTGNTLDSVHYRTEIWLEDNYELVFTDGRTTDFVYRTEYTYTGVTLLNEGFLIETYYPPTDNPPPPLDDTIDGLPATGNDFPTGPSHSIPAPEIEDPLTSFSENFDNPFLADEAELSDIVGELGNSLSADALAALAEDLTGGSSNPSAGQSADVLGTSGDDIINASYSDANGASVDSSGQTIGAGAGADTVVAGAGADIVDGGRGDDTLTLGGGVDIVHLLDFDGNDIVTDFAISEDQLQINSALFDPFAGSSAVELMQVGSDTVVIYGFGDSVTLADVDLAAWQTANAPAGVNGTDEDDIIDASFVDADGDMIDGTGQTIFGNNGNDQITAGAGGDQIYAGLGNDIIIAGEGDDTIIYTGGHDVIYGKQQNRGEDTLDLSQYAAVDVSFAIDGPHIIITTPDGTINLNKQVGYELGHVYSNIETVLFSDGSLDDAGIRARLISAQVTEGDDVIQGTNVSDVISSGQGNDQIRANSGNDTIIYTGGNDNIRGGEGHDTLDLTKYASADVSFSVSVVDVFITTPDGVIELDYQLRWELGDARSNIDILNFSDGSLDEAGIRMRGIADQITDGDDTIAGSNLGDVINAGLGNDSIAAGIGDDTIIYAGGNDVILGNKANYGQDTLDLTKYASADVSFSTDGQDVLITTGSGIVELDHQVVFSLGHERTNIETIILSDGSLDDAGIRARAVSDQGSDGNDSIIGTRFNDVLNGGQGNDQLSGGLGADTFIFDLGDGQDTITDFENGIDTLNFASNALTFADLVITTDASGTTLVAFGVDDQISILNSAGQIEQSDFIFV